MSLTSVPTGNSPGRVDKDVDGSNATPLDLHDVSAGYDRRSVGQMPPPVHLAHVVVLQDGADHGEGEIRRK